MSDTAPHAADQENPSSVTALHPEPPPAIGLPDATEAIRSFNASNRAHEDLWSRTRHATDIVNHAADDASQAETAAAEAQVGHRAIQAENPERRSPRPRQLILASVTVALDGLACNFAAQALGSSQRETLVWTALFIAVLASGELALDLYRNRKTVWRLLAGGLGAFVAMLGMLRYSFLTTVGTEGKAAALVGATLFTAATASFVVLGYRALRAAETVPAWNARQGKLACERSVRAARERAKMRIAERDRLADAYLSEIRASLLRTCTASQLPSMEQAVRSHLIGQA
jgi:hypothetical protein